MSEQRQKSTRRCSGNKQGRECKELLNGIIAWLICLKNVFLANVRGVADGHQMTFDYRCVSTWYSTGS